MGAPKGNTNALKHGLYAKHFSQEEQAGLRKIRPEDYEHEIAMMRVVVKNLFELHKRMYDRLESLQNAILPEEVEALTKITNSLSLAVTALNTTARTYALFSGTDTGMEDAFDKALGSLAIFLDDKYLIETNEEMDEREILVGK